MAQAATAARATRTAWRVDGFIVAAAVDHDGRWAALALGSGRVRLIDLKNPVSHASKELAAHKGAALTLAAHPAGGFVTGGDDGQVAAVSADGVRPLAAFKGKWVEQVACLADGRIVAAVGRQLHLLAAGGAMLRSLGPHPSTVQGVAVRGAQVAACHYNGISLWDVDSDAAEPRAFDCKGSHITVALSPDGRFLASAMQDGEIHAWRLTADGEMRMSGYPTKVRSLSWSPDSLQLATSGASVLMAWQFDGKGPEGRPPRELYEAEQTVATRVAYHPTAPTLAGGFDDGSLVMAATDATGARGGRIAVSKQPISALAWSPTGSHLIAGAEDGRAVIIGLPQ